MNITLNALVGMGLALLLAGPAACTQRPEAARDASAGKSPAGAPAGRKVDAGDAPGKNAPSDGKTLWSGESGGYMVRWTKDDLTARGNGGQGSGGFSLAGRIHDEWAAERRENDSMEMPPCEHETSFRPLSVVGSIISIERSDYVSCPGAAHPGVNTRYIAIDAADPGRSLALTDFFSEGDILAALLADALVKKALAGTDGGTPGTLRELVTRLTESNTECEYGFEEDLLTRFAFHHLEGGKVAVRIGLSEGAGACHGMLTQLGILLPAPRSLAGALGSADAGRSGFLMRDLKKIAGDARSAIAGS